MLSFYVSRTSEHPPFVNICVDLEFSRVFCLVFLHVHLVFLQHPPLVDFCAPCVDFSWFSCVFSCLFCVFLCSSCVSTRPSLGPT